MRGKYDTIDILFGKEEDAPVFFKKEMRELYGKYRDYAYDTAIKILGDKACAEDAVQITFEKLIKNFSKYNDLSCHKMIGLIVIISRNTAINIYNERKRENYVEYIETADGAKTAPDTMDVVIRHETYSETVDAIKNLPEIYRDVFLMKHVYGYDNREIAKILGISEDNVRQRLVRARQKIVKILERSEDNARK